MEIRIPLENGVMVVSWQGVLVLAAVPLVIAAIVYLLVSLRRKRRTRE